MADITIIDDQGKKKVEDKGELRSEYNISGNTLNELQEKAIIQVLGLENESEIRKYRNKIQSLLEFAKGETDDHSFENLKWIIRSLELKLGTPPFAENKIDYIARYAYILGEERKIKREKEQFERKI